MSSAPRRIAFALGIVAVALLAHWPLFRAGWLGDDLQLLRAAASAPTSAEGWPERVGWLEGGRVRPLHGALLMSTVRLHLASDADSIGAARTLRIVSFLALLAAAAALGLALRRALRPWVDDESARAAGWAAALLAAAHPLGSAAVARPGALGDLVALALAGAAAAVFLRGRQAARKRFLTMAAILTALAGSASSLAVLLAPVLAFLEYTSGPRPRPRVVRVRTAATTFAVFGACALLESLVATLLALPARREFAHALPDVLAGGSIGAAATACVEKLGVLFLPVPTRGGPDASLVPAYLACVAIAFLALWPALRAARSAPRLWGRLVAAWLVALVLALVPHAAQRVVPGDSSKAEILMCAVLFASAGMATGATALSGSRRVWIPFVMALGFAWLGSSAALPWVRASHEIEALRADIDRAYAVGGGRSAHVLVVDPPVRAAGLDLGLDNLALLVDPRLAGADPLDGGSRAGGSEPRAPMAVMRVALSALAREPEFGVWRRDGLALVMPERGADGARTILKIPATLGSGAPVPWFNEGQSPLFELDPSSVRFARIAAMPGASAAEAPMIGWRSGDAGGARGGEKSSELGSATGVWLAGESGPVAVFDLSRSMDWWKSRSVRRVSPRGVLVTVALAELLHDLPLDLEGEAPRARGVDWVFRLGARGAPKLVRGETRFVLTLLDVDSLAFAEIACERSGSELTAHGAAGWESEPGHASGSVAWSLECRAGDAAVARSSGRR